MENFENNAPQENSFFGNYEINEYLLQTSKWGKFLAIMGYIGVGLLVLVALFMLIGGSMFNEIAGTEFPTGLFGASYFLLAALYFIPVSYLYRFSVQMKHGLMISDVNEITSGFRNLKSLYKFFGILTIVLISLYALIIIIAVPVALFVSR